MTNTPIREDVLVPRCSGGLAGVRVCPAWFFLHNTRDKAIRSTRSQWDNNNASDHGPFPRHLPPAATNVNAILDHLDLCSSAGIPWRIVLPSCYRWEGTIMGKYEGTKEADSSTTRVAKGTCDPHGCLTVLFQESEICVTHLFCSFEPADHGYSR